jgi:hypothetical protein
MSRPEPPAGAPPHQRPRGERLFRAVPLIGCLGFLAWASISLYAVYEQYVRLAGGRFAVEERISAMSVAMINRCDEQNGRMVPYAICGKDGEPLLSWRVAILPSIGHADLYHQFNLDEPWDGPNNSRLIPLMPEIYAHPLDRAGAARGLTYYRVFTGPNTPFLDPKPPFPPGASPLRYPASFRDGTSNTILIVEAGDAVPWTKPYELPYDRTKPLPKLGGHFRNGLFVVALADGTARAVGAQVSEDTLRALIDPDDGRPTGSFDW